jgi:beta-glucanase (GH16 family)
MKAVFLPAALSVLSVALSAEAVTSAEFYPNQGYQFGRFEARIQFGAGDGVISSFFLWKNGSEVAGTFWNELDFEKLGADCHLQTNAIFGSPSTNHEQTATLAFDICSAFHTYAYEWTPDYIAWLVDGVEIRREAGAIATAFAQNTANGMQLRFNIWPGDASFGGNFDPSKMPVYQYINWVQYSAYENGAFQLKWRQDFTDATVPSGWLTGNWKSPKGLSTHSPSNIGFVDGYAVLSLTADTATGITGASPSDTTDGTGGASSVGGATSTTVVGGATSTTVVAAAGATSTVSGTGGATTTVGMGGQTAIGTTTSATNENQDDSGCSCETHRSSNRLPFWGWAVAITGILSLLRRRTTRG